MNKRVTVPRSKHIDYFKVAENFYQGAETAKTFDYFNAAGVLMIHAAIAYADAITIKIGGVKNAGEDHRAVCTLLKSSVIADATSQKALTHLMKMIDQKNLVSYSGEIYSRSDIDLLEKHLHRFRAWAIMLLE